MKTRTLSIRLFCFVFIISLIASGLAFPTTQDVHAADRNGAWVDTITVNVEDPASAVSMLQNDQLDLYSTEVFSDQINAVRSATNVTPTESFDLEYQLLLNVVGPEFNNGKFNPFCSPKIREALNWLIDRKYIANTILKGVGDPQFLPFVKGFPEYIRYQSEFEAIATEYAYDFASARTVIHTEMTQLGATWTNDHWYYHGEPIVLIFLIRRDGDGNRIPIGDYIADQLEDIGFTIDRQYLTSGQAAPIWINSNPADGFWHMYTAAWTGLTVDTDQSDSFEEFYLPTSPQGIPAFQVYNPSQEFTDVVQALSQWNFTSWDERNAAFKQAMQLAMEDSAGIWLATNHSLNLRRKNVTAVYDLDGLNRIWPYTVRFDGEEGGNLRVGQEDLFLAAWNPISGSTWQNDSIVINATADDGLLPNPANGLPIPQRVQSAAVTVQTGQVVQKTGDWVSLSFAPQIQVPTDAWVDWDATTQTFVTAAEKFPDGITAKVKSVVTYPADLFSIVKWHDSSLLDAGDFIMAMILKFDRAKPNSAIYDSSAVNEFDNFMSTFKGVRIVSTNPLVIETYSDKVYHDAETNVVSWWPGSSIFGPMPWHTLAIAIKAEEEGQLAFSYDKADTAGISQTDFIAGSSLNTLSNQLTAAQGSGYLPYAATLSAYITPQEVSTRYTNLSAWFTQYFNFWVGDGPFYLDTVDLQTKQAVLKRVIDFPDPAGKWDAFSEPFLNKFIFLPAVRR